MNVVLKPFTFAKALRWMERQFTLQVDVFCDEAVPEYIQQDCGLESGGIVAIGLILPGTWVGENDTERRTNLEDSTWWDAGFNESPQTHWLILNTRGSKAAGTPVEEDGYGLNSTETTGDDQEIVFEALGVLDNRDFWAGVNKRPGWGFVTVSKGTGVAGRIGHYFADANVYADVVIDQSVKSRIRISGRAKMSTDLTPGLPFTAPASIFTP